MPDQRFLVTARKYRPQRFAELVAQDHVTGTLKNAVRLDRLAHAYLFTGPRGVGKTTAARILAKAINCTTPLDERDDGAEPCRQCESCRSFEESRNLNIIEIDAASNNRVDDVRDLRETVRIPPQGNRKKVYIVDEVHMLTTQAFNALLKTLEEPPPHVLFIFATTEPHKVLPTIQSRCQRFDFRRIPAADIVAQLRAICEAESIRADDGSLVLIARRGDGALRDSLSVFDQAVSLCGEDLTLGALVEALGVVSEDLYFEASSHAAGGDSAGMMRLVDGVVRSGYDLQEFLDGFAEHLRNLLVARTMPDTDLIEAAAETRERYARTADDFTEAHLLRLLSLVDRTMEELRTSRQPRLRLELSLLRMATLPSAIDLKEALDRLDKLGVEPTSARPAVPVQSARPAPPARAEAPSEPAKRQAPRPLPAPPPVPVDEPGPEPVRASMPEAPPVRELPEPALDSEEPHEPDVPGPAPGPPLPSLFDTSAPPGEVPGPSRVSSALGQPALRLQPRKDEPSASFDLAVVESDGPSEIPEWWDDFVARMKEARLHVGALLSHAEPEGVAGDTIVLGVPDDFHVRVLHDERPAVERVLREVSGGSALSFRTKVRPREAEGGEPTTANPEETLKALCEEYPALRVLMERFGGEIVW